MTSSQAGRELDALVAEKVMGYTWEDGALQHNDLPGGGRCHPQSTMNPPPAYSTDIAAAWAVVDKLDANLNQHWSIVRHGGRWCVFFNPFDFGDDLCPDVEADTFPLAICLAALKAVGH